MIRSVLLILALVCACAAPAVAPREGRQVFAPPQAGEQCAAQPELDWCK